MYIAYIFLLSLLSFTDPATDSIYSYHQVSIREGDGVFSLLRRYKLQASPCNIEQFYQLNNLDQNAHLQLGKKYKIPVCIFQYNGKSIRSTIGVDNWDKAIRIKEYNEKLLEKGLRRKTYQESKVLWVPHHEIFCKKLENTSEPVIEEEAKAVKSSNYEVDDLYGKKYEKIEIVDNHLKGMVFYVVSGHGGPDPGAVCKECPKMLCEDEYAYDVSLRLARNLKQHGAIVEMVIQDNDGIRDERILKCDSDERLANGKKLPLSQRTRLRQRTLYVNNKYSAYKKKGISQQYLVSIHVDSRNEHHKQDVFFCHYGESDSGKKLAGTLQKKFEEKYNIHQKNRGYHGHVDDRSFYILANTFPPATLIELANIKNTSDHRRILQNENRQALANWIYEGLHEHALAESKQ